MGLSTYFNTRFKLGVHITQLYLIIPVIIISIVRVAMKDPSPQRAHIMGISIVRYPGSRASYLANSRLAPQGLKSIIFILFQILTEHTLKFQKWANKKTNIILNCIDIPFWAVMMGLLLSTSANICVSRSCAVGWIMVLLAIALL